MGKLCSRMVAHPEVAKGGRSLIQHSERITLNELKELWAGRTDGHTTNGPV